MTCHISLFTLQSLRIFFPIKAVISSTASPPYKTPPTRYIPPPHHLPFPLSVSIFCPNFFFFILLSIISLFYVFFFSSNIQVQPTNQQTNYAVCIPQFHLPSACLPLHLSPSALCCSFVFKQLGAEWPWLERELLCSFGQLVLHSVNKDSSGLVLGAQQHCNMDTFLIKKRANKELSIIQGGKTLDLCLRLNQQTDMLLMQNTSRQYQKLIC